MTSLWEILKASKGLPAPDGFTALFARSLSDTYTLAEISGIPPLTLGEVVEIADYTIYGNTYQAEGVSPDTPQEVVGCGDYDSTTGKYKIPVVTRGKNLYQFPYTEYLSLSGSGDNRTVVANSNTISNIVKLSPNTTYCLSGNRSELSDNCGRIALFSEYPVVDSISTHFYSFKNLNSVSFTTTADEKYALVLSTSGHDEDGEMMLELGTEATSYEPYVEPITTPIYLDKPLYKIGDYADSRGMREEVRKVKELVLTGEGAWTLQSINEYGIANFYIIIANGLRDVRHFFSTHFIAQTTLIANTATEGIFIANNVGGIAVYIRIKEERASTVDEFKSYLAVQYANGTPVTIYYVLATPETTEVDAVEIPTLDGTTVIDVETEIEPSNVKIKYKSRR